jgi:hypothetical protein
MHWGAGTITSDGDTITVTLDRRAYSPILRQSDLAPTPPSHGGKTAASASSSPSRGHDSLHGNPR